MKCVKLVGGRILRVSNERAAELVKLGNISYCPKSEWKEQRLRKQQRKEK